LSSSWIWGLSLIVLTVAIHAVGMVTLALVGVRFRVRLEARRLGLWHAIPILVGVIGAVGLLLAVLHGIEAAIWAAAYLWERLLQASTQSGQSGRNPAPSHI
jgi:hypothetical protein